MYTSPYLWVDEQFFSFFFWFYAVKTSVPLNKTSPTFALHSGNANMCVCILFSFITVVLVWIVWRMLLARGRCGALWGFFFFFCVCIVFLSSLSSLFGVFGGCCWRKVGRAFFSLETGGKLEGTRWVGFLGFAYSTSMGKFFFEGWRKRAVFNSLFGLWMTRPVLVFSMAAWRRLCFGRRDKYCSVR